jgi:hypothetical protein
MTQLNASGRAPSSVSLTGGIQSGITPTIANVAVATAATEVSYTFPANTVKFRLKTRNGAKLQYAYTTGQTNTTFDTVHSGDALEETMISIGASTTIYFQCPNKGSETVEIVSWASA